MSVRINALGLREHELKCWPEPFEATWRGDKRAEFRQNDRDFRVRDSVVLKEFDPERESLGIPEHPDLGRYTGREMRFKISHIVYGPAFGVPDGFCMLTLEDELTENSKIRRWVQPGAEVEVWTAPRTYKTGTVVSVEPMHKATVRLLDGTEVVQPVHYVWAVKVNGVWTRKVDGSGLEGSS